MAQNGTTAHYDRNLVVISIVGQAGLAFTLVFFFILGIVARDPYGQVWELVIGHLIAGRVGNILIGLHLEFPVWFVFVQCMVQDVLGALLLYPLFVMGIRQVSTWRFIRVTLLNVHLTARKYKGYIERFGPAGLALFVAVPLWSTGTIVGAAIGHLMALKPLTTFISITLGNVLAVAFWMWLVSHGIESLEEVIGKEEIIGVIAAVFVLSILAHFFRYRKRAPEIERKADEE